MPTQTSVYNLNKPTVAGDPDTWGGSTGLNGTIDKTEAALKATATTGSSNAYVLSSGLSLTAYATGLTLRIIPNFTNSGAATINVDGLGAKNITKLGATAVASGDITSGRIYTISYDGTQFQIVEINALDPTLSTIAALTPTTDQSIYFTGSDTAATYSLTSAGRSMSGAASATAQTALLDAFTGDSGSGGVKGLVPAPGAGDSAKFLKASGGWALAQGSWGSPITSWTYSSAVAQVDFTGLGSYSELLFLGDEITSTASESLWLRWSTDNGSTFITATEYRNGSAALTDRVNLNTGAANAGMGFAFFIGQWNTASWRTHAFGRGVTASNALGSIDTQLRAKNAVRFLFSAGTNFTGGRITVYGKA